VIDLDAARAARREADKKGPVIRLEGVEYELAVEMPIGVLDGFRQLTQADTAPAALSTIAEALLGEHYEALSMAGLSVDDLNVLIEGILSEYGVDNPPPLQTS